MPNYIGVRTTSQQISETRSVRDVDKTLALYDPEVAPLITILNRVRGRRKKAKSTKIEWFEGDYIPVWAQNGAAQCDAGVQTVNLATGHGVRFVKGDLFCVPVSGGVIPEVNRVTNVSTDALTVVRDIGGTGSVAIPANAALRIIGSAHEEDGAFPDVKTAPKTPLFSYTQIERTATSFSNTAEQVAVYGLSKGEMNDRDQVHYEAMVSHKRKMNDTLLWGRTSQDLTGGPNSLPIRTTMGLRGRLSTNVTDASGMLTRKKFGEFSRSVFRYGPKSKLLVAAPVIKQAINEWGVSFLKVTPSENKFGLQISTVETAHGIFKLVNDWMLEDGVSGQPGFANMAFAIDLDEIWYCWLRDTKVFLDAVKDGRDGKRDEIRSEYAYKIKRENRHGLLYGVTDYMQ